MMLQGKARSKTGKYVKNVMVLEFYLKTTLDT
jgi:hypothetical protein